MCLIQVGLLDRMQQQQLQQLGLTIWLLCADPGPVPTDEYAQIGACAAFVLPSQMMGLLQALGSLAAYQQQSGVVGVCGAIGGCGASVVAGSLALAMQQLSRQEPVVYVDASFRPGQAGLLFGVESSQAFFWDDVYTNPRLLAHLDIQKLLAVLDRTADGLAIIGENPEAIPSTAEQQQQALTQCCRALVSANQLAVIDFADLAQAQRYAHYCQHIVLVVPAELRALAVAQQYLNHQLLHCQHVMVILRHRLWSSVSREVCEQVLQYPVTAELFLQRSLPKMIELHGLSQPLPKALRQLTAQCMGTMV